MTQTNQKNPFIEAYLKKSWNTKDESIPFSKISLPDYLPALKFAVEEARKNIVKIKSVPASFENTILALEASTELSDVVSNVYFNLFNADANEEFQSLAKEIAPLNAALASEISLDADLFAKVKLVFEQMGNANFNPEQKMLIEKTYKGFTRNGALLNSHDKEKLKKIDQELSTLGPQFSENVLKATNQFELWITDKKDLEGLPESAIEAAALDAKNKNQAGKWLVTLQAPSYIPFIQYAKSRSLREKLWFAYASRSVSDATNNQQNILKIVQLKHERAKLIGYENHAEITLTERMAENSMKVFSFLQKILKVSKPAAEKDLKELKDFAKKLDGLTDIQPWDFSYYSEKLKEEKFKFNEEELRPYFKLENVVQGVFIHASKLYGLHFKKLTDIEKYNKDVETYEVSDEDGNYIGLFYTDFFPRESKKSGAWMTTYRDQGLFMSQLRRPHVSIVCNFTKPTESKPSLLTYDEVLTLFHEFGHSLHGLLSKCHYRSLAGTNVFWDFVELPSQIMENWVKEKDGLDIFAKHFETNATIPKDLIEKIKKANQFQAGYYSLRQVSFALLDMAWHTTNPTEIRDVIEFENKITAETRLFPYVSGTNISCAFSHIFAGGYSAGYYSYKWAEVLDADAFEYFKEKGIFNKEVATKFKEHILQKGGTEHPMDLYKKFRGREPNPEALFVREGLL